MAKLQWPPTAYGELVYGVLVEAVQQGRVKKGDAADLMNQWFEHPSEVQGG